MTPQEKIKALAGLRGLKAVHIRGHWYIRDSGGRDCISISIRYKTEWEAWAHYERFCQDLTTRDAIVNLAKDYLDRRASTLQARKFIEALMKMMKIEAEDGELTQVEVFWMIFATSLQLADALLIAAGLMKD